MQTLLDAKGEIGDGLRHGFGRETMAVTLLIDVVITGTATARIKGRIAEGEQDVLLLVTKLTTGDGTSTDMTVSGLYRVDVSGMESVLGLVYAWTGGTVTMKTKTVIG